jgi:hypothetical protein
VAIKHNIKVCIRERDNATFGALLSRGGVISQTAHITFLSPYEARVKNSRDSLATGQKIETQHTMRMMSAVDLK